MRGDLSTSADIAFSGMKAQAQRLKVISENMANAESVSAEPGKDPYRRQVVTFKQYVDKETGAEMVKVGKILKDQSDFIKKYAPDHPAADEQGYVSMPNVNPLIEMMDMKEAQRSYEANLSVVQTSREMNAQILDILK